MPIVIAVVSRKGGQGKSTLAVSLAAAAVSGKRPQALRNCNAAILVDCDSQGSASRWALPADKFASLGLLSTVAALEFPARTSSHPAAAGIVAAKTREELVERAIERCLFDVPAVPGLRVVPSCPRVHVEDAKDIAVSHLPADVVVVDTGADCSTYLVRSVIKQANYLVCPVMCEPWGIDAVAEVIEEVRSCGRSDLFNRGLSFVVSKRQRNKVHDILETSLRQRMGDMVSAVTIPQSAPIGHVSGGPQFLTAKHAMWGYASKLWEQIANDITTRRAAA